MPFSYHYAYSIFNSRSLSSKFDNMSLRGYLETGWDNMEIHRFIIFITSI